jgi:hypothetical protein
MPCWLETDRFCHVGKQEWSLLSSLQRWRELQPGIPEAAWQVVCAGACQLPAMGGADDSSPAAALQAWQTELVGCCRQCLQFRSNCMRPLLIAKLVL